MILCPNAKINLGLEVVRRREDGYHDIETLFVPVPSLRDVLEVVKSDEPAMKVYGLGCDVPAEKNLCYKGPQGERRKKRETELLPCLRGGV